MDVLPDLTDLSASAGGPENEESRPLGTGSDLLFYRRAGEIRTHDPLTPSQVRYQAAPQPVAAAHVSAVSAVADQNRPTIHTTPWTSRQPR